MFCESLVWPSVTDPYNIILCAIVTIVMQSSFFFIAVMCKCDKVMDIAGGSNFVVIAVLTFAIPGSFGARQIAVTIFIILWGVRLSGYLLYRIIKIGEDKRFDEIRGSFLKFAGFWFFQALWVFTVSLPVIFINVGRNNNNDFGPADIIGTLFFCFGLIVETVADQQKFCFRNNPENKGKFCNVGLWQWSRHPNYLGEITLWLGIFIMSCSSLYGGEWMAVLSPVFITFTLLFVTGVPLLEKRSNARYGNQPDYQDYKKQTSPILFCPTSVYSEISSTLKCVFFCEFPFYSDAPSSTNKDTTAAPNEGTSIDRA